MLTVSSLAIRMKIISCCHAHTAVAMLDILLHEAVKAHVLQIALRSLTHTHTHSHAHTHTHTWLSSRLRPHSRARITTLRATSVSAPPSTPPAPGSRPFASASLANIVRPCHPANSHQPPRPTPPAAEPPPPSAVSPPRGAGVGGLVRAGEIATELCGGESLRGGVCVEVMGRRGGGAVSG